MLVFNPDVGFKYPDDAQNYSYFVKTYGCDERRGWIDATKLKMWLVQVPHRWRD
jgi:hypothetical protein